MVSIHIRGITINSFLSGQQRLGYEKTIIRQLIIIRDIWRFISIIMSKDCDFF